VNATNTLLTDFIARLPKVELHLHLEGSVRPETLRELARTKGWLKRVGAAYWAWRRARQSYRYGSFRKFLRSFGAATLLLETPEDYALATRRLVEWLGRQNVRYAEVTLSAGVILWKKQSVEAVFDAVSAAAAEVQGRTGVRINWIFDAIRHFGVAHVREVLRWAERFGSRGVVALGIGGDEARGPAGLFAEVYAEARGAGLHRTAHAGEVGGPESIRQAVELLGAERIGHGLAATRDPAVMALLRERRIPLEVCLTSNVATGILRRLEDHPLRQFLEGGLVVTLNSDDPAMFGTSVTEEFLLAANRFGLTRDQLVCLSENAIRATFLPATEQQALLEDLAKVAGVRGESH
jgi:adenosine deaminase/aminodeoxyfutalosine deaminase